MPFDPRHEDYLRLSLRFERTLDGLSPSEAAHEFASFGRRFAREYDSLPQTDADRAFHLVTSATALIDYELPFVEESAVPALIQQAHSQLEEAVTLDPTCDDARRMLAASEQPGFDAMYDYLASELDEVEARCKAARAAEEASPNVARARVAADLAMRPYLRWLANMASQALICGRNLETLRICEKALDEDPTDAAGVRFTAALACAKLEDEDKLNQLLERKDVWSQKEFARSAWVLIARLALAYKKICEYDMQSLLGELVSSYPHARAALVRQAELPEGVFSRIVTAPYSENELIVALSEAAVLLQEGRETDGYGALGIWLAREAEWTTDSEERSEIYDAKQYAAERAALIKQRYQDGNEGGGRRL